VFSIFSAEQCNLSVMFPLSFISFINWNDLIFFFSPQEFFLSMSFLILDRNVYFAKFRLEPDISIIRSEISKKCANMIALYSNLPIMCVQIIHV
jgi:hypothetical protein